MTILRYQSRKKACLFKFETVYLILIVRFNLFFVVVASMVILEKSKTSWGHYLVPVQSEKKISTYRTTYSLDTSMLKQSLDYVHRQDY